MNLLTRDQLQSRHPKLQYWFWDKDLLEADGIEAQLDTLCKNSDFDTVLLTQRRGVYFWDKSMKPYFEKAVRLAHDRGLKIILQLWPKGFFHSTTVKKEEAVALAVESEGVITNGTLTLENVCTSVKVYEGGVVKAPSTLPITNELIKAYAFRKTADGFYKEGTLQDITDRAVIEDNHDANMTVRFDCADLEGYTVYMTVAHYYHYPDLFGPGMVNDFRDIIEYYKDLGFDSFVLDEFKNFCIRGPWDDYKFRDRVYGDHFREYFRANTGQDLDRVLFDMRYCPEHRDGVRIAAINLYFDIFRHSTKMFEAFMADYTRQVVGEDAFIGLHNTFHNWLHDDEIWTTCVNWWEVPRTYAQTDEDIVVPIRMGIACQCKESLMYDMYYHKDPQKFADKVMRDAAFGCRLHYHAMNDGFYGVNTGSEEFLKFIMPLEEKITLLNCFDPAGLPKMELLVVFGFPRFCNWYPDESIRGNYDINIGINVERRCRALWNEGYLNALAPSDAIDDGRITLDADGNYDYCGHKFRKLLYLYPQYAKPQAIAALTKFAAHGNLAVIGELTHDFNGEEVNAEFLKPYQIGEDADIAAVLKLTKNRIEGGYELEDGSVVLSDIGYATERKERSDQLCVAGHTVDVTYQGVFAVKLNDSGKIEKAVCGDCRFLALDGETLVDTDTPQDIWLSQE